MIPTRFSEYINSLPLVDEEKEMWLENGFYIDLASDPIDSSARWEICTETLRTQRIPASIARELRQTVIDKWNERKRKKLFFPAPGSEDEEFRDNLQARNSQ